MITVLVALLSAPSVLVLLVLVAGTVWWTTRQEDRRG